MKKIIWKLYFDYEKQEKWLNEMSAKGLAMTDYTWCRYVFEDEEPNEYTYRIELLDNEASRPESQTYISLLEDSGVECIASHLRWRFLRKKTSEGALDLYTDIESKINYSKRVYTFFMTLALIECGSGLLNFGLWLANDTLSHRVGQLINHNLIYGAICLLLGLLFLKVGLSIKKKINALEKEKLIRE